MKIYEIGTGYTSIPADKGAATEIVVENLSKAFVKLGHDVTVVDIEYPNRRSTNLSIVEVPMPRGFGATDEALGIGHKLKRVVYSVKLAGVLKRLLKAENEKVVLHFHNQYNAYFFYKLVPERLRRKAFVAYTVHSYIWHGDWREIAHTVKTRYFQEVDAMRKADVSFVLNAKALDSIVKNVGIAKTKLMLTANGVDTESYRPLPKDEVASLKHQLGLDGLIPVIQVGSVCDRKNQIGALEALAPLMVEDSRLVFIYIGGIIDKEYKARLDSRAAEYGLLQRVKYFGEVSPGDELNKLYNLAIACLFTTKAEAFGLVVLEAMASGIPTFVNSSLKVDLRGCERFSSDINLRAQLKRIIDNPQHGFEMGASARKDVLRVYSWDKVAESHARIFVEKLGKKSNV